jgi:peptide/nickel transport system permease protein
MSSAGTSSPAVAAASANLGRSARRSSPRFDILRRLGRHPSAVAGGTVLVVVMLLTIFAPLIAPFDPLETFPRESRLGPSRDHWLGTDQLGRDIWSRILWGGRVSLMLGLISVAIGGIAGTLLGICAGYFRGYIEIVIMQFIDILLAFPGFLLALAAVSVLGTGINNVMIAVGIALVPGFARVVRSSTLSIREMTYVESARVVGVGNLRIMRSYILPNVLAPIMVLATVDVGGAILTSAALSFLGLGAQPPKPEWGLMINEGRRFLRDAWWISTFPGVAIMISVIAINLIGDALRDVLDPRLRTR